MKVSLMLGFHYLSVPHSVTALDRIGIIACAIIPRVPLENAARR